MSTHRWFIPAALLGAALSGCAALPEDRGRGDVAALLQARGQAIGVASDPAVARQLLMELEGRALTIDDAIRLALINNPRLTAEYAQLGFAAADVYDAGRLSNPSLSASLLFPNVSGEANQVGFGLVQSFTNLLLLPSRSRFAEGELERVKQLVGAQALDLAADTASAYYELVGAWQMATMREAVAKAAQAAADLAQRFFDAGNINRLELALEQAAASQAQLDVLQARTQVTQARSALNTVMGLSASEGHWKIADRLPAPVADEDDASALLDLADNSRLDLAAARRRVTLLADALGVTRRFRYLGNIDVGVETERETDRSRITGPTLALELPIFNQGKGRVARAQAELQQADAQLRALEADISNGVRRAAADVASAKARARQYRESLIPLRETIVARTQEEVNFMLVGQFELLLAKQQEYDAYQGYLEAVRDYWLARAELARQVGTSLPSDARIGEATLDPESLTQPATAPMHMHHEGMQMDGMKGMDHSGHDMKMPGMTGMEHGAHGAPSKPGQKPDDKPAAQERPHMHQHPQQ
ncbi:MAG: TolC family protein [Pseudomonadota bacterium]|nr:TolC family protein [Pseudomonadota bacterium]